MSSKHFVHYVFALVAAMLLISCGPVDPDPSNNSLEAYPANQATTVPSAYPVEPLPTRSGTLLALDRPINAGQTTITGVGPAGLSVTIMNITFLGEELGSAVINNDGTFSINVNPAPAGVRIGLRADLTDSGLTEEDIRPGEGEVSTPRVGYFHDSVVIPQQN